MNIGIIRTTNLDNPILPEALAGALYMNENQAHRFAISCTKGNAPVTLAGSVSGRFIRPDGQTVLLTGSITEGVAYVTLPQSCYIVPGRFVLALFNVDGGATTTIYAAMGNVARTQTGSIIDPGNVIPDIDDLLAEIENMRTATAAAEAAASQSVRYNEAQPLTDAQQETARGNIGAASEGDVDELKSQIGTFYVAKSTYPSVYLPGYIRDNGTIGDSTINCVTRLMLLDSANVTITFKPGYNGRIAEYSGTTSSSFVKFIQSIRKSGERSFVADLTKRYAFDIFTEDGSAVTPSTISDDAVTITYNYITDKTLSQSEKAADAKVVGDCINAINNALNYSESIAASLWEQGAITASTGNNAGDASSALSIRTKGYIDISYGGDTFETSSEYAFSVYGWSKATYLGFWTGDAFTTSGSSLSYLLSFVDISALRLAGATRVRIVLRRTDGTTATPDEGANLVKIIVLPIKNHASINAINNALNYSESIEVSLWEQGAITTSTGNNAGGASSALSIRTKGYIDISYGGDTFETSSEYAFSVYGWSKATYLGFWTGDAFTTSGSSLSYLLSFVDISALRLAGATRVRIVLWRTDGTTATPDEGANLVKIIVLPIKNHADINTINNALNYSESPYNHGNFDIRRGWFGTWYSGLQSDYSEFDGSTTYAEIIAAFDNIVSKSNGYVSKNTLGTASGTDASGNSYYIYEYVFVPTRVNSPYYFAKMPKLYMDGSIHGFEKNSTYGLYYFLKDLVEHFANNDSLAHMRSQVEIHVIPVVNPWGFDNNEYVNGNGVNVNRNFDHPGEWTVVTTPSTEVNGLAAFDQPESTIVKNWLLSAEHDILMYFNCHTNGHITTGYNEMNPCMTSNDRNDNYFNKLIGVFTNHIELQTIMFPAMYSSVTPSNGELCGNIATTATENSTRGIASAWANTMRPMLAMTLEVFNGLRDTNNNIVVEQYSPNSKKMCSEIMGNLFMQILAEYSPY